MSSDWDDTMEKQPMEDEPSCRSRCCKCHPAIPFLLNFLVFLLGGAVMGLGIWLRQDPVDVTYLDPQSVHYNSGSIGIIVAGSGVMVMTLLGCIGAGQKSGCLLWTYLILLILILIGGIVGSVLVFTQYKHDMQSTVTDYLTKATMDFRRKDYATKLMTEVESKFGCCGASRGAMDYLEQSNSPMCKMIYMVTPCAPKLLAFLEEHEMHVIGAVVGILSIILGAAIGSVCMICKNKEKQSNYLGY